MHRITKVLYSGAIACSIVAGGVVSASATNVGTDEGCTPGFWKNHTEAWPRDEEPNYSPTQKANTVFTFPTSLSALGEKSLLQSLQGGGGDTVAGASQILLRAATAAILNADDEELDYPYTRDYRSNGVNIIFDVNQALKSGDRERILALAATLDAANNLGCDRND